MDDRLTAARAFVAVTAFAGGAIAPLAGDASFRRYFRVAQDGRTAVLMDAPPDREDVRPFLNVASVLAKHGYSAPHVLAADATQGFLLLEDLGDDLYNRVLGSGGDERALYEAAIDLLVDLHGRPVPDAIPPFEDARALREVCLFLDWTMPALLGRPVAADERASFEAAWRAVFPAMNGTGRALVLFDYHADNLLWLPRREGLRRVGLLDFQDAVAGPPAYDLVSLIEDARRDVPCALADAMIARYLDRRGPLDRGEFMVSYAVTGAQRNTRILGVFGRLFLRDGKASYLKLLPRVWGLLERDLTEPALAGLRAWFADRVPPALRRAAPEPAGFRLP